MQLLSPIQNINTEYECNNFNNNKKRKKKEEEVNNRNLNWTKIIQYNRIVILSVSTPESSFHRADLMIVKLPILLAATGSFLRANEIKGLPEFLFYRVSNEFCTNRMGTKLR